MQKLIYFIEHHTILFLVWLSFLVLLLLNFIQNKINKIHVISKHSAITLMNRRHAIVIDLRNQEDYSNGHIINSLNLNFDHIKTKILDKKKNSSKKTLILVCNNEKLSKKILKKINKIHQSKNFTIYVLEDGINGWKLDDLPLIKL